MDQMVIMGLDGIIASGMAGAVEETGKSEDELFDLMQTVHTQMNAAGKDMIEALGFEVVVSGDGDSWSGLGAGLMSLLYLMHAKATVEHIISMRPDPEPIN